MAINLANLKSINKKRRKRLGRGNSSGKGTYAGRGLKGQRSRSGGRKRLSRRGLKQFLHQIPKNRGFKSCRPNFQVVNLDQLENNFESGEVINAEKLLNKGLIRDKRGKIKVLGRGKATKKFNITVNAFSKSAKESIVKAGGAVNLTVARKLKNKKEDKKKV